MVYTESYNTLQVHTWERRKALRRHLVVLEFLILGSRFLAGERLRADEGRDSFLPHPHFILSFFSSGSLRSGGSVQTCPWKDRQLPLPPYRGVSGVAVGGVAALMNVLISFLLL